MDRLYPLLPSMPLHRASMSQPRSSCSPQSLLWPSLVFLVALMTIHPQISLGYLLAPPQRTCRRDDSSRQLRVSRCLYVTEKEKTKEKVASEDEFAHLVESHPLDDDEPTHPAARESSNNPYNIPTDPDEEWEWFYSNLNSKNKCSNVIEESLLRHWMAQQRKAFMKTLGVLDLCDKANWGTPYLSLSRKKRLDSVYFPWGHLQPSSLTNDFVYSHDFQRQVRLKYKDWKWNDYYDRLCRHYREMGNTQVSSDDDGELVVWTVEQRRLRWDMPERRRRRLDELHFDWDYKGGNEEAIAVVDKTKRSPKNSFAKRLTQLKEYRKVHGDVNVPLNYEKDGLGLWVQRMQGRRSKLSPSSIEKLEKIGLIFDETK